jgi:hypothetical protein
VEATDDEVARNPRSRSAKLRVARLLDGPADEAGWVSPAGE